jgi:hypothetical protein
MEMVVDGGDQVTCHPRLCNRKIAYPDNIVAPDRETDVLREYRLDGLVKIGFQKQRLKRGAAKSASRNQFVILVAQAHQAGFEAFDFCAICLMKNIVDEALDLGTVIRVWLGKVHAERAFSQANGWISGGWPTCQMERKIRVL